MSSRPTRMKSVMSAVAVLKNFHGLSSQASMRIPAAVKTRRGEVMRIVSTAMPMARAEGPASCRIRFCRARETTVPRAPRVTRTAPMASCLRVDRCGTGSGMSRIARTMFSFDTRNDAIPIVAIVMRNPIAKPVSRSEMVHVSTSPPPNPPWKTWEKPHRMTPAMRRPPNMPTTEERSAYRSPSDTKLWTRFFRRMPRARATPISPLRSSASMTKMLTIRRMPAMIVKKLRRTNTWERRSAPSVAPLTESAFACATVKDGDVGRCDSSCDAAASDRRYPCSAPPTFATRITLIWSVTPSADCIEGSGTNRSLPSFHAPRPASLTMAATVTFSGPRGPPKTSVNPSPRLASTAAASFSLITASVGASPEPSHAEPSARTNEPRSRPASNPIRLTVGSKRLERRSIAAPLRWMRGATAETSGIEGRFAAKVSYTLMSKGTRLPSGVRTEIVSSTKSRDRKTALRIV